jgi:thiamine phosphate synthase YjbQ (UPF0047 family)
LEHHAFAAIGNEDQAPGDIWQDFNEFLEIHFPHRGTCEHVHQSEESNKYAQFIECFDREPECWVYIKESNRWEQKPQWRSCLPNKPDNMEQHMVEMLLDPYHTIDGKHSKQFSGTVDTDGVAIGFHHKYTTPRSRRLPIVEA